MNRALLLAALLLIAVSGCRTNEREVMPDDALPMEACEYVEMVMASPVRITIYSSSKQRARKAARAAFDRMHQLERTLSDWIPESESNRLERNAPEFMTISTDLGDAIKLSRTLWNATDRAFDPTIGPLVELWRVTRKTGRMPHQDAIAAARSKVDFNAVELREDEARIKSVGVELDFGGIGKGIALDEASRILDEYGLNRHLIDFDGEILAGDEPPGRSFWQVELTPEGVNEPLIMNVVRCSIATSGGLNQFFEIDGRRYSHVIDPSTGFGTNCTRQVTVLCESAAYADALATAGCVLDTIRFEEILRTRFQNASAVVLEQVETSTTVTRIGDPPVRVPVFP